MRTFRLSPAGPSDRVSEDRFPELGALAVAAAGDIARSPHVGVRS